MNIQETPIKIRSEYIVVLENTLDLNMTMQLIIIVGKKTSAPIQMFINLTMNRYVIHLPMKRKEAFELYHTYVDQFFTIYESKGLDGLIALLNTLFHDKISGKKLTKISEDYLATDVKTDA
jgi:hypothetical protein